MKEFFDHLDRVSAALGDPEYLYWRKLARDLFKQEEREAAQEEKARLREERRVAAELAAERKTEIRVLIATDVLSEGLNLQDATRIINYDLHWNPVRLMQRIGRVDRRMDPEIEERIVVDHPDQKMLRGETAYWNFLPPEELDRYRVLILPNVACLSDEQIATIRR